MNPQMFEQMKQNMSHSDAKMAAARMATMSDQELRDYAKMAGMPGMTPEMMRMSAQMMSGMDSNQFNQYKNMAGNMGFPGAGGSGAGNSSTSNPTLNRSNTTPAKDTQKTSSNFPKIEGLKSKGNDFFKSGDMDQAGSAYFEAILEIEELRIKSPKLDSSELTTLEVSCRLNYATVKSKQGEWDISLEQAQKALKYGENGKAIFRIGQAQYHLGNKKEAVHNLRKASKLLTTDSSVKELLDKCEAELERGSASSQQADTSKTTTSSQRKEEVETKPAEDTSQSTGQSKLKKKAAAGGGLEPEFESQNQKTTSTTKESSSSSPEMKKSHSEPYRQQNKSEVVIEEERKEPAQPEFKPSSNNNYGSAGLDETKINQAREGLANMSPDQMKMATDFMKNADASFIRQMMKQQTGMDMSDDQINMMKSMMTPEMLQMAANNPGLAAGLGAARGGARANANVGAGGVSTQANADISTGFPAGFPSFGAGEKPDISTLMNNPDMMKNMMNMLSKNPEMLKGMSKMLGESNPLSKLLENKSPEEIEKMMGSMQKVFGVFQKVSPAIVFIRKYWKHMLILFVAYLFYRYAL
mmetsp:Transcript_44138/g.51010  ORF Transcript_44138/g.51010 Transcript_44138/m.51010 type:complete len:583 (-) Transcript_44138:180-1928(-)